MSADLTHQDETMTDRTDAPRPETGPDTEPVTEAETQPEAPSSEKKSGFSLGGLWQAFTRWRRSRPFWGCLILALGGWMVMKPMVGASFQMVVHMGMRGASPYILGGGMMTAALLALVLPSQRYFPAIMAMVFSVLSLPFANLGGWIIGMVLGIIGSGLVFAWTPYSDKQLSKFAERAQRRAARRAQREPH